MKKLCCLLLALMLFAVALIGCTTPGDGEGTKGTQGSNPITDDSGYTMDVPKMNYNGQIFTVLSCEGENAPTARYWTQFGVDEETPDALDSVLYARNTAIEEYLGIDIELSKNLANVVDVAAYRTGVTAGDDEYQLAAFIDRFALQLAMEGLVLSYNDLEDYHVNLENPWWDQEINAELTILNKQYLAAGAYQLDLFGAMTVLLFNKQIVADKNLDNIYELVENGTWTMEAMAGMMAKAYSDVDGDTVMTDTDVWGAAVAGAQWSQSFFPVSDKTIIAKDNEDIPYLNASSDRKLLEIIEYQWNTLEKSDYFMKIDGDNAGGTTSSYWDGMVYTTAINMFSQEKALFTSGAPMYLVSDYLRNMQSHFGIVPYPTFDEVKPGTGYGAFMPVLITHVVPYNTSDPELASAFLEYAAYYSYNHVVPTYEDTVLSIKGTRDDESGVMLAMMRENRKVDLCRTYFLDTAQTALGDISKYGSFVWASGWQKHTDAINAHIDRVVAAFEKLN